MGDKLRARVIEVDDCAGTIRLAKAGGRTVDVGGVMQAKEAGVPVEGKITGVNKGGYEVDLGKMSVASARLRKCRVFPGPSASAVEGCRPDQEARQG